MKRFSSIQEYYDALREKGLYHGTYQTLRRYIRELERVLEEAGNSDR